MISITIGLIVTVIVVVYFVVRFIYDFDNVWFFLGTIFSFYNDTDLQTIDINNISVKVDIE